MRELYLYCICNAVLKLNILSLFYSLHGFCKKIFLMFSPWILGQIRLPMTPYIFNLMKFWLSYLRLKTIDSISKIDCSSITCSLEIEPCLLFTLNISAKTSSNQTPPSCFGILITNRFQKCHWESNLTKNSWRKHRKYLVANWTMHTIFHTYLQNNKHYSVKLRKILLKTLYIL